MSSQRAIASFVIVLVLASATIAQPPEPLGIPPQFAIVSNVDTGAAQIHLIYTASKPVYETKTIEMVVDGKKEQKNITVCKWVSEAIMKSMNTQMIRYVTAGKERLDVDVALARLQPGTVVLFHPEEVKFDPRYLKAIAPQTMILLEKKAEAHPPASNAGVQSPAPAPAPSPAPAPAPIPAPRTTPPSL